MILVDSSVAIAAALTWHDSYERAVAALPDERTKIIGHVGLETYSVLTRLPAGRRISPRAALEYLRESFDFPPVILQSEGHEMVLERLAQRGLQGGAIYDALVGATARQEGATLLSLDTRAVGTYEAIGVDFRLV